LSRRFAVVGGGISGLVAALELAEHGETFLYETTGRLGGKLATSSIGGLAVDEGAESFLVRTPEVVDLASRLGLADRLAHPAVSGAALWTRGRLRALPARTLLGVPGDRRALAESRVLSPAGLLRAAAEPWLPRSAASDADLTVAHAVGRRLGSEVVDRLVEPLLGGVYAGRADRLSVDATLPALASTAHAGGSLVRAARAALPSPTAPPRPLFATLTGGMGELVGALTGHLAAVGVSLRTGCPVTGLRRTDSGFQLALGELEEPAQAVVLACPARPASRLLAAVAPPAARELAGIDYASVAIITLAYPADEAPELAGSGFLVPAAEGRMIKAATFMSSKWAHLGGAQVIVRCSVGRHGDAGPLQRDDPELAAAAAGELAAAAGLPARPRHVRVTRWGGALPQYELGHLQRVARIRAALAEVPGLAGCGAVYDGVGIPACIRSARAAVAAVLAAGPPGPSR
jgi:oxygen-dependent protoporphyrinogen oxidase